MEIIYICNSKLSVKLKSGLPSAVSVLVPGYNLIASYFGASDQSHIYDIVVAYTVST
jgi:hypothetical protein